VLLEKWFAQQFVTFFAITALSEIWSWRL